MTSYIGRFAPSPTGPLHEGSLLVALASFLDCKSKKGIWKLRIEDIDLYRNVNGADEEIKETLISHGLHWDGEVETQKDKNSIYQKKMQELINNKKIFFCDCRREDLKKKPGPYPGYCRSKIDVNYKSASIGRPASHAIRFNTNEGTCIFDDLVFGKQEINMDELGDCILRRRDGLFAYQFAVVVDDAKQGITNIVRGADLIKDTAWQIKLQEALKIKPPQYCHIPIVVDNSNLRKLSKQTGAPRINNLVPVKNLNRALSQLKQTPPPKNKYKNIEDTLDWAINNWDKQKIPKTPILSQKVE
jgi:glutamyl-Q tRNA(Asp) synthetase